MHTFEIETSLPAPFKVEATITPDHVLVDQDMFPDLVTAVEARLARDEWEAWCSLKVEISVAGVALGATYLGGVTLTEGKDTKSAVAEVVRETDLVEVALQSAQQKAEEVLQYLAYLATL